MHLCPHSECHRDFEVSNGEFCYSTLGFTHKDKTNQTCQQDLRQLLPGYQISPQTEAILNEVVMSYHWQTSYLVFSNGGSGTTKSRGSGDDHDSPEDLKELPALFRHSGGAFNVTRCPAQILVRRARGKCAHNN